MQENGFLRVQAVFRLVKHHRLRPVHDVGGDFLAAVRRQAMHEDGIFGGLLHQGRIDLIGFEQIVAVGSIGVMHGNPCIGYHAGGAGNGHISRRRDRDIRPVAARPFQKVGAQRKRAWRGHPQLASQARYRVHE